MKLETRLPVIIEDKHVDNTKRLRLAALLLLTQDAATTACERDLGIGPDRTRDKGLLWVVARYHFEIERLPELNEAVEVLTWQSKMIAFFFMRNYQILDKNDHPIVKGISAWTIIDANTRQVIMPKAHGLDIEDHIRGDELPRPGSFRLEKGELTTTLTCNKEDMDTNKHMNNVVYLDKCAALIPDNYLNTHTPTSFDVNYKKELRLGESTELSYSIRDGECFFDSDCFSLVIRFDKAL